MNGSGPDDNDNKDKVHTAASFGINEMLDLVLPRIAGEAFSGGDTAQQRKRYTRRAYA
jgi:hypothetical protein